MNYECWKPISGVIKIKCISRNRSIKKETKPNSKNWLFWWIVLLFVLQRICNLCDPIYVLRVGRSNWSLIIAGFLAFRKSSLTRLISGNVMQWWLNTSIIGGVGIQELVIGSLYLYWVLTLICGVHDTWKPDFWGLNPALLRTGMRQRAASGDTQKEIPCLYIQTGNSNGKKG
jgi:hypothetical protein